jgi:two-component system response regulator AtoC/two-component system response regulator HupR/HoxA
VDAKKFLLVLDGDEAVLKIIARLASPYYQVRTAREARRVLEWLHGPEPVAAIMTEHVLHTASGVSLLETARSCRPGARRILMTTYHDLPSIVAGLHSGAIERLVQKPFSSAELLAAILPERSVDATDQRASA